MSKGLKEVRVLSIGSFVTDFLFHDRKESPSTAKELA
jgi:hypothetical protein